MTEPRQHLLPVTPWLDDGDVRLYHGDAKEVLAQLEPGIAQTCVTSPPYYGLRDYGTDGQIGLEPTPDEYVARLVDVFRGVRRVLRDDGTLWLNLGDSYTSGGRTSQVPPTLRTAGRDSASGKHANLNGLCARPGNFPGSKPKDLIGIPWRVAFALQADGWYLRSDIIWAKPNPMPSSVTDRPTCAHEYLFLLAKSQHYYYDADAVAEPAKDWSTGGPGPGIKHTTHYGAGTGGNGGLASMGERYRNGEGKGTRNRRTVWTIPTQAYSGAHFAVFPPALIEPCIKAGAPEGGVVLDPFSGSGTTAWVARHHGRHAIGIELNEDYLRIAAERLGQQSLLATEEAK